MQLCKFLCKAPQFTCSEDLGGMLLYKFSDGSDLLSFHLTRVHTFQLDLGS